MNYYNGIAPSTYVKNIQTDLGFIRDNVDGYYGNKTEEAVKELQKSKKVKCDGVVGEQTKRLLLTEYYTIQ